ncbi:hypothetical protein KR222_009826 [Zaprionus bogoriensis]|nr:hypothetical protein KR222_009826 [Zaprionus bogoriensis]
MLFPYKELDRPEPAVVLITAAILVGSLCLLGGFVLLYSVSRDWRDESSEALLLTAIGFFVTSLACVTWKLTNAQRLAKLQQNRPRA